MFLNVVSKCFVWVGICVMVSWCHAAGVGLYSTVCVWAYVVLHCLSLSFSLPVSLSLSWIVMLRCFPLRDACIIGYNPYYTSVHTHTHTVIAGVATYSFANNILAFYSVFCPMLLSFLERFLFFFLIA